jgi:hypothetical protein
MKHVKVWTGLNSALTHIFSRFSQLTISFSTSNSHLELSKNGRKFVPAVGCKGTFERTSAQLPLHTPVNELHSIDSQALTNSFFLLT